MNSGSPLVFFSASSDREIRRWEIPLPLSPSPSSSTESPRPTSILAHETGVNALFFDNEGDLWTASADKSTRCLSRDRGWAVDTVLEHPDFVNDVLVHGGWVVTACRDEEVRIWGRGVSLLRHLPCLNVSV